MKPTAFLFTNTCPICDSTEQFHVLVVDDEPTLAGPLSCKECGKPFCHSKILLAALEEQDNIREARE